MQWAGAEVMLLFGDVLYLPHQDMPHALSTIGEAHK